MQAKNEILEELRMLSCSILPGIRLTPYRAPEGYFEDFSAQILRQLRPLTNEADSAAASPEAPGLLEREKEKTFAVPDGYFENFAQNLLNKIKATQAPTTGTNGFSLTNKATAGQTTGNTELFESAAAETAKLSPIVNGIGRAMPYHLPSEYFEELSPILTVARLFQPYAIPDGYFDEVSALLTVAKTYESYTVPGNYFQQFPDEVKEQAGAVGKAAEILSADISKPVESAQTARIVQMDASRSAKGWLRYAAAAAIAGVVLMIGAAQWHAQVNTTNTQIASVDIASSLHSASDSDVQSYLDDQNNDQVNTLTDAISNNSKDLEIDDNDIKSQLGNIPDGELKQYIEEHGGANDIATN